MGQPYGLQAYKTNKQQEPFEVLSKYLGGTGVFSHETLQIEHTYRSSNIQKYWNRMNI